MKTVFLGYDMFGKEVYWRDLHANSSALIGGLSGSGKSYLTAQIISQFKENKFRIVVVSDKAKVDFKDAEIEKIDTLSDIIALDNFIDECNDLLSKRKERVGNSQFTHSKFLNESERLLVIVDELWSVNKLEKNLKKKFEDLCELLIRQGRYLSIFIIFVTQVSGVNETSIPIRQCSILITGKTDTRQLSESLFGTDVAYSNDFLRQGYFVMWDRLSSPQVIKVGPRQVSKISIYIAWILKSLIKIWTMVR